MKRAIPFVLAFLISSFSFEASAQCVLTTTDGCPCEAHRYTRGDGWNPNGTVNFAAPIGSAGIIGCFNPAHTQSNIQPFTTYNPANFALPILTGCIDPQTGATIGTLAPPVLGQKILWFNFDLRPYVQWFDFQVIGGQDQIEWALFCSKSPTSGTGPNGLSGDCSDMKYHICGTNFTGWHVTPFFNSDFLTPANYYLMVWDVDPTNNYDFSINFKGRFGCSGDPVYCYAEEISRATTCHSNGTYTVSMEFAGVNGNYRIRDNTGSAISTSSAPSILSFTNPSCSAPNQSCAEVTTGEVFLTYPIGTNYDFSILETTSAGPIASIYSCDINAVGLAPSCPVSNISVAAIATNASCFGVCDGIVSATNATGGTGPYSYVWDGGLGTGQSHSAVCAGTYNMVVTDASGSSAEAQVIVTEPALLTAMAVPADASAFGVCDGSLAGSASAGTPPYSYTWDGGLGSGQNFISVVCASTYTLTVTDANGCIATTSAIVGSPPAVITVAAIGTNATCFDQCDGIVSATNATGGTPPYGYSWDGGLGVGQSHNTACSGTYIVTATDANGAMGTAEVTISRPSRLSVNALASRISGGGACDGSLYATGSGGTPPYTYLWDGGVGAGPDHVGTVCFGSYSVTITDANGCVAQAQVSVGGVLDIPTISEWGLMAFILLLLNFGLVVIVIRTPRKQFSDSSA